MYHVQLRPRPLQQSAGRTTTWSATASSLSLGDPPCCSGPTRESKVCVLSHSVMPDSLPPHGLQPSRLLCPWDLPGKNTGMGCHFLLQGIFLTQGLNQSLLHCRQILYHLSYQRPSIYLCIFNIFLYIYIPKSVMEEDPSLLSLLLAPHQRPILPLSPHQASFPVLESLLRASDWI